MTQALLERQIEVRRIDTDEGIWWAARSEHGHPGAFEAAAVRAGASATSAYPRTARRSLAQSARKPAARMWMPPTPCAAHAGKALLQRGQQQTCQQVAGGFTGDHGKLRSPQRLADHAAGCGLSGSQRNSTRACCDSALAVNWRASRSPPWHPQKTNCWRYSRRYTWRKAAKCLGRKTAPLQAPRC